MSVLARTIHDSGCKISLAATGGGVSAIAELFATAGASRGMLEALVPYASEAMVQLLGGKPDQFCSSETARAMAMACYERGRRLIGSTKMTGQRVLGAGCTASLVSDQPKRGEHRVHAAIQSAEATLTASLHLEKGRRSRIEEDQTASQFLLHLLAAAATGRNFTYSTGLEEERVQFQRFDAPLGWRKLLAGECAWTRADEGASFGDQFKTGAGESLAVYCGAFHPRHEGHRRIVDCARARFPRVVHEIAMHNVDKPPLDFIELSQRARQFSPDEELVFTACPTFVEKARVFPGCTFLVGYDTIARIGEPRYYGGAAQRDAALDELHARGCRFLVFGRRVGDEFHELDAAALPAPLSQLCECVPECDFRLDISSTEIRRHDAGGDASL